MTPIAEALCNALLDHHRNVCTPHGHRPPIVEHCVIAYGDLCDHAGYPDMTRRVGRFLQEVADWCNANEWPPLNSLAVNGESNVPGDNYDAAPGCSIINWEEEARACILFEGYPETAE